MIEIERLAEQLQRAFNPMSGAPLRRRKHALYHGGQFSLLKKG
ncbi:MAG TPA: hypothetical protein VEY11_16545 [Pyrinomonadaceae bacterium]|nr:hypothetical protein [Pyrinomonadaceae bacterium]